MDLKREYDKLYQHWQEELKQIRLSPFTQEDFNNYKKIINEISDLGVPKQDLIKNAIKMAYQDNLNFLLSDFLRIREIKIINAALALQEIDFNNVIEAEKMFFQNLVSSIKGFEKMKALSIYDGTEEITPIKDDVQKVKDVERIEKIESKTHKTIKTPQVSEEREALISELVDDKKKGEFNYTLLRFLKETPALVGIDLVNYGPFEKDDVANLPFKNAKILLFEKFAEKIEIG
jgi:DNA replication initiation complex subunit (GINS family)